MDEPLDLAAALRGHADREPDRRAFVFLTNGETPGPELTYGKPDERALAVAAFLEARRLRSECVLLLYPDGIDVVVALFGCLYSGALAVPAPLPESHRP